MLVHHADAGLHRVAGAGEVLHLVVQQDLARIGLLEAVEHVHQGDLPAPFSPSRQWISPASTMRSM